MRRRAAIALALTAALVYGCTPAPEPSADAPATTRAVVVRQTDGDTARFVLDGGAEESVRFIGIDTPEIGENAEPFGEEAAAYTAGAIPVGATVWLETDAELRDRYGRLLAYVWLEEPVTGDGAEVREKMLNALLVLDGYANAYTYPPNVKYTDVLRACEREARESGRGFWAE
ncbi:MAG: hypothetical protein EG823_04840 [Actinobacteria bacterium]|nr:hypothetical protein [Actinomycetota bacterium]